jgi:hypothetical protein
MKASVLIASLKMKQIRDLLSSGEGKEIKIKIERDGMRSPMAFQLSKLI